MKKRAKLILTTAVVLGSFVFNTLTFAGNTTITITKIQRFATGLKIVIGTVAGSSSYATGGDNFDLRNAAANTTGVKLFGSLSSVIVEPKSGYIFDYDHTNRTLLVRYTTKTQTAVTTGTSGATVGTALNGSMTVGTLAVSSGATTATSVDAATPTLVGSPAIGTMQLSSGVVTIPTGFRSAVDAGVAEQVAATTNLSSTPGATKFVAFGF